MGIGIPTEEEMPALPDPELMVTTDSLQLNELKPVPLKFDEDAMDWSIQRSPNNTVLQYFFIHMSTYIFLYL